MHDRWKLQSVDADVIIIIIIIIIIKNEKIRVTLIVSEMTYNVSMGTLNPTIPYLCENAVGVLYIVNKMCVDGQRNVEG